MTANDQPKLTPDQYAELIKLTKPYLLELEERVESIQFGTIEIRIEVRAGVVEKMTFFSGKTWLKAREKEPNGLTQVEASGKKL